jgi:hypothetical protein
MHRDAANRDGSRAPCTSIHFVNHLFKERIMIRATKLAAVSALVLVAAAAAAQDDGFTKKFPLASCQFISVGGNRYFPLIPGRQLYYSNAACVAAGKCDALNELWITEERETKRITLPIGGTTRTVVTRVVQERETEDGELVEISRNYFANCWPSRDVYYFGEDVDIYKDGKVVGHESAWLAGRHGARPGIVMPEDGFITGSRYYQEVAPDVALDRAEHKRTGFATRVPAGRFDNCLEVEETTVLEPDDIGHKTYCRGVGLVKDDDLELTAIYANPRPDDDNDNDNEDDDD